MTRFAERPVRGAALLLLFLLVLVPGCASVSAQMNSWMGHSANELIIAWGPPSEVSTDGAGGQVLVYVFGPNAFSQVVGSMAANDPSQPAWVQNAGRQNLAQRRIRMFYVNAEGRIYSWRAQGR